MSGVVQINNHKLLLSYRQLFCESPSASLAVQLPLVHGGSQVKVGSVCATI